MDDAALLGVAEDVAARHQVEGEVVNPARQHDPFASSLKQRHHAFERSKRHKIERTACAGEQVRSVQDGQQGRNQRGTYQPLRNAPAGGNKHQHPLRKDKRIGKGESSFIRHRGKK